MNIEILSAKFTNPERTQIITEIRVDGGEVDPFYVATEIEDSSEIYQYIMAKYRSGELVPDPFVIDLEKVRYDLLSDRDHLLDQTDKFMVIDSILSDDEIKSLKEYRKSLRDISTQKAFPNVSIPNLPDFLHFEANGRVEYGKPESEKNDGENTKDGDGTQGKEATK